MKEKSNFFKFCSVLLSSLIIISSLSGCNNKSANESVSKTIPKTENKSLAESNLKDTNKDVKEEKNINEDVKEEKNTNKNVDEEKNTTLNEAPRTITDTDYYSEICKKIVSNVTEKAPVDITLLEELIKTNLYNAKQNNIDRNNISSELNELLNYEMLTPIGYEVLPFDEENNLGIIFIYTKEGYKLVFESDESSSYSYNKYDPDKFNIGLKDGIITAVNINASEDNINKCTPSETNNNDVKIDENTKDKLNDVLLKYADSKGYKLLNYDTCDFNEDTIADIALLCRIDNTSVSLSILNGLGGKLLVEKSLYSYFDPSRSETTAFSLENVISSNKKQIFISTYDGPLSTQYLFNYHNGELIDLYENLHKDFSASYETSCDANNHIIFTYSKLNKAFAVELYNENYNRPVTPEELSLTPGGIQNTEINKIEVSTYIRCSDIMNAVLGEITQYFKWENGKWNLQNIEMNSCYDGLTISSIDKNAVTKEPKTEKFINIPWYRIPDKVDSDFKPNIIRFTDNSTLYSSYGADSDTGEDIFTEDKYDILSTNKNVITINLEGKGEMTLKLLDNGTKLEIYDSNNKLFFHGLTPEEWKKIF